MIGILIIIINILQALIFVSVILSWLPNAQRTEFGRLVNSLTDPILRPFRVIIPMGNMGGIDLSAIIVILGLNFIASLLSRI